MKAKGFTLVELLVAVVIMAVLVAVAYPLYGNYVKNARLSEAHQAMMDNAQALERHYANHANFKKNSTQWADLPMTQTSHFCIRMLGNPRGTESEAAYSMKAVSFDKNREPRVLVHSHDGTSLVCESSATTCDETPFFNNSTRMDSDCRPYP
ncbi:MAG: prepilin-type N-terminal cleavage/methylation domain-containing protein [Moraxella sp.]|nr:MAG: prepilin-type N-terminal cleavage/methylation domain-containing protein [Moraxella sp.]